MCGCGRSTTPLATTATQSPGSRDNGRQAAVPLKYRGRRALLIRGPATGIGYACYRGDTIHVHVSDAKALIDSGVFAAGARSDNTVRSG
jgi:hypothetical protein